jgi:hypothetical protein
MFRQLSYMGGSDKGDSYLYRLDDSEFWCNNIEVKFDDALIPLVGGPWRAALVLCILQYIKRVPAPSKTIAKLYHHLINSPEYYLGVDMIEIDKNAIDKVYPDIKYGTKYFNCVVRQFARLEFTRVKR